MLSDGIVGWQAEFFVKTPSAGFVAFDGGLGARDYDDITRLLSKGKEEFLDRLSSVGYAGMTRAMIEITQDISILEEELVFKTSRSGGPGGQNVNKVNTRVTLFFDVANCENFSEEQKKQILARLTGRADKRGVIRVTSQKYRTQKANREAAVERLQQLLADALKKRPVRKKIRIPYAVNQRRLEEKKRRSQLKQQRARKNPKGNFGD
ncbi:alternative ribosome rescue aminoacyl-tRNA hydrolase ArfB [Planctomycetota bacterium]